MEDENEKVKKFLTVIIVISTPVDIYKEKMLSQNHSQAQLYILYQISVYQVNKHNLRENGKSHFLVSKFVQVIDIEFVLVLYHYDVYRKSSLFQNALAWSLCVLLV